MEITPLAAESMGVRSLCTRVTTPDLSIVLDPSAAVSTRYQLEPHPLEYELLLRFLESIFVSARKADLLSVSHYHYDHVRPGFTDFMHTFGSREELQRMFEGKTVLAKDARSHINHSQKRRAHFFQKDLDGIVGEIRWADGQSWSFGDTLVTYSQPLPHGPESTFLGYVIATIISHGGKKVLFAPDVQGPVAQQALEYCISSRADLAIVGGPPIYLSRFKAGDKASALSAITELASQIPTLVVDHHLLRSPHWKSWLSPAIDVSLEAGNKLITMAQLAGLENRLLEAKREKLYVEYPPDEAFMNWTKATEEYKRKNKPPLSRDLN
jgi:predicted metallo-beta-lactamase superfamily hydrolase